MNELNKIIVIEKIYSMQKLLDKILIEKTKIMKDEHIKKAEEFFNEFEHSFEHGFKEVERIKKGIVFYKKLKEKDINKIRTIYKLKKIILRLIKKIDQTENILPGIIFNEIQ